MSKKPQPEFEAEESASVAPALDPSAPAPEPVAVEHVPGRALIDLPDHGLRCGEFGQIPPPAAQALCAAGHFDLAATSADV